jgi:opacity protein-like surface antigen
MRQLVLGSLVGVVCLSMSASAGERAWYAGIEGGVEFAGNFNDNSSSSLDDTGLALFATLGRDLGPSFSLEGELGYRSTDEQLYTLSDIDQISAMVNAVYELPLSEAFSLSIGAGLGLDYIQVQGGAPWWSSVPLDDSDVQAAAQLKFGLNYEIGETTDLSVNYRRMTTFEGGTFTDIDNATLTIGLRFAL